MNNTMNSMIALRYSLDAWLKTYPELSINDWEEYNCPDNYIDFFAGIIFENKEIEDLVYGNKDFALIQVIIDDQYFEWLERENKENTPENRILYGVSLTKEERIELIKKNHMDRAYTTLCIALSCIDENPKKEYKFKLSKKTRKELTNYLGKIFGKNKVYVPGYVLQQRDFVNIDYMFTNMTKVYVENNYVHENTELDSQENEEKHNLLELCIPVIIHNNEAVSAFKPFDYTITDDHMPEAYQAPEEVFFTEEGFDEFGILGVEDFLGSEVETMIKNDIGLDSMIDPFLSDVAELIERHDELIKTLEDSIKKRD